MDVNFSPLTSHLSPLIWIFIGYMCGSIPTGYWIGKQKGIDLTKVGSGGTGATNVLRTLGKGPAFVTLLVDMLKGFLPVYFALNFGLSSFVVSLCAISCIIGHSKSVFLKFKGGKSSATGLGVLAAISWQAALVTFLVWVIVVLSFRYSSLGSIVAVPLSPLWLYLFKVSIIYVWLTVFVSIYIVLIRHRENIQRLLKGTEPKIGKIQK